MPLDPRPKFDVLVNDYDSAGWAKVLPPPHFPRHAQHVNEGRIDTPGVSQEAPHVLNCHGRRVNQGAFRLSPNTTGVHLYRCCHLGYPLLQGVEVRAPPHMPGQFLGGKFSEPVSVGQRYHEPKIRREVLSCAHAREAIGLIGRPRQCLCKTVRLSCWKPSSASHSVIRQQRGTGCQLLHPEM